MQATRWLNGSFVANTEATGYRHAWHRIKSTPVGILRQIRIKLHYWAVGPVRASCYSLTALSLNCHAELPSRIQIVASIQNKSLFFVSSSRWARSASGIVMRDLKIGIFKSFAAQRLSHACAVQAELNEMMLKRTVSAL